MDYKEAYKSLEAKIKKAYLYAQTDSTKNVLESILPGLVESEDEKIRKEIVDFIKDTNKYGTNVKFESWMNWLEKQKPITNNEDAEKASSDYRKFRESCGIKDPVMLDEIEEAYYEGALRGQEPIKWSEADQITLGYLADFVDKNGEDFYGKNKDNVVEWIRSLANLSQKPIEVNGEDYGIDGLWHAQRILEQTLGKVDGYQSDDGMLEHKAAITAVKKLEQQKHIAWSKEDEWHIKSLLTRLEDLCKNGNTFTQTRFAISEDEDWLKSLKPLSHWKPSDEQMKVLKEEVNAWSETSVKHRVFNGLYNDLKKLKEE